jgi:signal transduction histidine kinase
MVVGLFISFMVGRMRRQRASLEEANLRLARYARTMEDLAASRERARIAQELHDTLSHTLSGLSVQLEAAKAYWEVDPATAREALEKSLTAARAGLEETRRVLLALRARPLEELGLAGAIRRMAKEAAERSGLELDLLVTDHLPLLAPDVEQCIFRIAQEAITNTLKHARAKRLSVHLELAGEKVRLTVIDDGAGFNPGRAGGSAGFGLLGMKERAAFCNAELNVTGRPGAGTTVQLEVRGKTT